LNGHWWLGRHDLHSVAASLDAIPLKVTIDSVSGNHTKHPNLPFHFAAELLKGIKIDADADLNLNPPNLRRQTPAVASFASLPSWGEGKQWPEGTTSVMVRNIPNRYTTEEILEELVHSGFAGGFDFFYLPIDFETKKNKGYFFLNLCTPDLAQVFKEAFSWHNFSRYKSNKVPEVSAATTQGFESNVWKYLQQSSSRINNPWFKPMIFLPSEELPEVWHCHPLSLDVLPEPLRCQAASKTFSRRRMAKVDP